MSWRVKGNHLDPHPDDAALTTAPGEQGESRVNRRVSLAQLTLHLTFTVGLYSSNRTRVSIWRRRHHTFGRFLVQQWNPSCSYEYKTGLSPPS